MDTDTLVGPLIDQNAVKDFLHAIEEVKKSGANVELDSPEEFANFIRSEIDRWSKVVKAAGITPS